jgi:hypothetical protein
LGGPQTDMTKIIFAIFRGERTEKYISFFGNEVGFSKNKM